jgi:hypothetical protein
MIARAGIVLALLQLAFALTWVAYATFLPALAAQVGIDSSVVPWILLADQAIFVVCDWLAGAFSDRVGDAVVRFGRQIAAVTVISCAAFLALPWVAPSGFAPLLLGVVVVWSVTSSALRAPPLMLAGRHASRPQRAWLASLYTLGMGIAGAVTPYVAGRLAALDPRIPFAGVSCIVAVLVLVLVAMPSSAPAPREASVVADHGSRSSSPAGFVVGFALLAIGLQIHGSIRSAAIYRRYVAPDELSALLPVFWLGFALASLPVAPLIRRVGGSAVMIGAGIVGVAALVAAELGGSLAVVIAAQLVAGAAWAGMLVGAFAVSTNLERRPGSATGLVLSTLAAATVVRIALVKSELVVAPAVAAVAPMIPAIAWAAGTLVGALLHRRPRRLP